MSAADDVRRRLLLPLRVALAAACVFLGLARAHALQPGEAAPLFEELLDRAGITMVDGAMEGPLVAVFTKADDAHSERFLRQLRDLQGRSPDLFLESNGVVVLSRLEVDDTFDEASIPDDWAFIRDEGDRYYTAYDIIATPTAVVIGIRGIVIGFHPGYSPGLVRAVQLDLSRELRGTEDMRTPAPAVPMQIQLGRRLGERGLWDRALGYYRQAFEAGTLTPPLLVEMADVLYENGEKEEATSILETAGAATASGSAAPMLESIASATASGGTLDAPVLILFLPARNGAPSARPGLEAMTQQVSSAIGDAASLVLSLSAPMPNPLPEDSAWGYVADADGTLFLSYGAFVTPTLAVIARDGTLVGVYPGPLDAALTAVGEGLRAAPPTPPADSLEVRLGRALAAAGRLERGLHYYDLAGAEDEPGGRALREADYLRSLLHPTSPGEEETQDLVPPIP